MFHLDCIMNIFGEGGGVIQPAHSDGGANLFKAFSVG